MDLLDQKNGETLIYRKKPVQVPAYRWWVVSSDRPDVVQHRDKYRLGREDDDSYYDTICGYCDRKLGDHGSVSTLEGDHIVCPGDWIICGVKKELYPCKPDIFEATYELVGPSDGPRMPLKIEMEDGKAILKGAVSFPNELHPQGPVDTSLVDIEDVLKTGFVGVGPSTADVIGIPKRVHRVTADHNGKSEMILFLDVEMIDTKMADIVRSVPEKYYFAMQAGWRAGVKDKLKVESIRCYQLEERHANS